MNKNIFDPFRFDRVEIQSDQDQIMLNRLTAKIQEFKDLAVIDKWEDVKNDRSICLRLQEAHNIMRDCYYPPEFMRKHRCCPCEMEGLCAIKHIVNGEDFTTNFSSQIMDYLGIKLDDPETIRKNIEDAFPSS